MASFYFLHIPKTAGTSFMDVLDRQFDAAEICQPKLWHALLLADRASWSEAHLFRGHFYNLLEGFVGRQLTTITFLRDPIDRALSHYAHVMREPFHYLHAYAKELGSLEAFILDPATRPMIADFQVRSLALPMTIEDIAAPFDEAALRELAVERALETWLPAPGQREAILKRAMAYLDSMAFVGITEHYEESIRALDRISGWSLSQHRSRPLNISPNRLSSTALSSEALALLTEANQLDLTLYRHGLSLLTRWL